MTTVAASHRNPDVPGYLVASARATDDPARALELLHAAFQFSDEEMGALGPEGVTAVAQALAEARPMLAQLARRAIAEIGRSEAGVDAAARAAAGALAPLDDWVVSGRHGAEGEWNALLERVLATSQSTRVVLDVVHAIPAVGPLENLRREAVLRLPAAAARAARGAGAADEPSAPGAPGARDGSEADQIAAARGDLRRTVFTAYTSTDATSVSATALALLADLPHLAADDPVAADKARAAVQVLLRGLELHRPAAGGPAPVGLGRRPVESFTTTAKDAVCRASRTAPASGTAASALEVAAEMLLAEVAPDAGMGPDEHAYWTGVHREMARALETGGPHLPLARMSGRLARATAIQETWPKEAVARLADVVRVARVELGRTDGEGAALLPAGDVSRIAHLVAHTEPLLARIAQRLTDAATLRSAPTRLTGIAAYRTALDALVQTRGWVERGRSGAERAWLSLGDAVCSAAARTTCTTGVHEPRRDLSRRPDARPGVLYATLLADVHASMPDVPGLREARRAGLLAAVERGIREGGTPSMEAAARALTALGAAELHNDPRARELAQRALQAAEKAGVRLARSTLRELIAAPAAAATVG